MYVSMKPILQHAHAHGYAVPAINCINMEMARGAISAAEEARAAIIINLGVGQMGNHAHSEEMVPMIKELAARATVPVALNLDHGGSGSGDENLRKAVSCGINKVNICTDAFQICKTAFLQTQAQQPDMDYMHLCMAVEQQMKAFTRHHLDVLGASGQYVYGENVTDSRE